MSFSWNNREATLTVKIWGTRLAYFHRIPVGHRRGHGGHGVQCHWKSQLPKASDTQHLGLAPTHCHRTTIGPVRSFVAPWLTLAPGFLSESWLYNTLWAALFTTFQVAAIPVPELSSVFTVTWTSALKRVNNTPVLNQVFSESIFCFQEVAVSNQRQAKMVWSSLRLRLFSLWRWGNPRTKPIHRPSLLLVHQLLSTILFELSECTALSQ